MIRAVIDVNVVISAVIKPDGTVGPVLDRLENGAYSLLYSTAVFEELRGVLDRPKFRQKYELSDDDIRAVLETILQYGECVTPDRSITACRDVQDNKFLEIAVAGKADVIVSGDHDLLVLSPFEGIPIIGAATFLHMLTSTSATDTVPVRDVQSTQPSRDSNSE